MIAAIVHRTPNTIRALLYTLLALLLNSAGVAEETRFETDDAEEIGLSRFAADGDYLLIWLAPGYGFREAHRALARQVAAAGIEVWQVDLVEALFLPPGTASMKQLDGTHVANLIEFAHAETGKKIAVAGDSYATITALRGARRWQQRSPPDRYLVGAVLFTPFSFAHIPPLGAAPEYLPIVESTNIPLMIYQAKGSATYGQFDTLLQKLRRHGSPVYTRIVNDVMSLFYEDPPTEAMIRNAQPLGPSIRRVLPLLAQHDYPLQAAPLSRPARVKSGIDIYLREYTGSVRPGPIRLDDVGGNRFERSDFSGKVTLVNFWATWCPPCIEEIPSLNRLKTKMAGRPFELISINYAEDRETVLDFMQRVKVDFPVLLDMDGKHANAWRVISYPSTFVMDKMGNIRYGVNAAIDWDSPELIDKLEALMR